MRVFVGGSSRSNLDKVYYDEALKLSNYLAGKNCELIIGCDMGIIEIVASSLDKSNVTVMEALCYKEDIYKYNMILSNSIKDRKDKIINEADSLIYLPGGIGTFDELFTSIESKRASEHNKEIIIVNINGYYDNLISMLEKMYNDNFASYIDDLYLIVNDVSELISYLDSKDA